MKRYLILMVMLLAAVMASAQITATGNITASSTDCSIGAACVPVALISNSGAAVVQLSGTFSATLQLEALPVTGGSWVAVSASPMPSGTAVTSATSTGTWRVNVAGFAQIRVRASGYVSGTAVVSITVGSGSASTGGGASTFDQLGSGTNTTAAMVVGTGASLAASGSGTITATSVTPAGSSGNLQTNNGSGALGALATTVSGSNITFPGTLTSGGAGSGSIALSGSSSGTYALTAAATAANAVGVIHDNGSGVVTSSAVVEADQTLADNTTNNSSTSRHGYLLKLDNTASHYMDGTGAWSTPAGGSGGGVSSSSITYDLRPDIPNLTINGVASFVSGTTATSDTPSSTQCAGVVANTGTTISTGSGVRVNADQFLAGHNNTYFAYGRLLQITDTRLWMGYSNQAAATLQAAAPTAAWNVYSFYYCNDAGATCAVDYTTYQAVTCGGSACTIADTGVTVDTSDHKFSIVVNGANTSVAFSIDGVVKATNVANIPATNTVQRPTYWETNLLGVNKGVALCGASLSQTW